MRKLKLMLFSQSIIETIVKCTNIFIAKICSYFVRERDAVDTNVCEIRALIGCLYIIGSYTFLYYNIIYIY